MDKMPGNLGKILIVDDVAVNRTILVEILSGYEILEAASGFEAIDMLFNSETLPSLVLLDIMMPEIDGFEVLSIMKNNPQTENIPVMFITAINGSDSEVNGLEHGAVDYITKPFDSRSIRLRVDNYMELMRYRKGLEVEVSRQVAEQMKMKMHVLEAMTRIVEYRDFDAGQHSKRTSDLVATLIEEMLKAPKLNKPLTELNYPSIISAVPMHDIGKIAIPDSILLKPSSLTKEEFEIIKTHTVLGKQMIDFMQDILSEWQYRHCCDICLCHHERWDGKGYPNGLRGEEIPLSARIAAVVDVYDALVSERIYKRAMTHSDAIAIIKDGAGSQFDAQVVEAMLNLGDKL